MKIVFVAVILAACTSALPLGGVAIDPVTSAKQITKVKAVSNLVPRMFTRERDIESRLLQPREQPPAFDLQQPNAFSRAFARTEALEPREKPRTRGGRFPRMLEHAEDAPETDAHPKHKGKHALLGGGGGTNRPSGQLADFTEL